ncbi:hypothetical protein [uncultured Maribacter sp.]|uniref:hypothetical protein n=1 Tax=uncultured Maribacter sp. TaxID=431308 RepID=UPI00262B9C4E|nr:hypothetical protein [uncultured Maribacter sp.]
MSNSIKLFLLSQFFVITSCKSLNSNTTSKFNITETDKFIALRWGTLGAIKNDKIKFYEINKNNTWEITKIPEFSIPKNEGLIPIGLSTIGIISKGTIKFHEYSSNDGIWKTGEYPDFSLSKNEKIISITLGIIGILKEGKITFYRAKDDKWILDTRISNFSVPNEGRLVTLMLDPMGIASIGVIVNDKLQIYNYDDDTWTSREFNLPVLLNNRIVSIGFGSIGIIKGEKIEFYPIGARINGRWYTNNIPDIPDFHLNE